MMKVKKYPFQHLSFALFVLDKNRLKRKYIADLIENRVNFILRIRFHQTRAIGFEIRKAFKIISIVPSHFKDT